MAPALTEPLSPTENLTNTAVNTVNPTPTTRSSRKLETVTNKTGIVSNNNCLKTSQSGREKRNRSGSLTINQTPTSSKRITRSRDNQFRNSPALKEEITKNFPKVSSTKNISKTICVPQTDDITVKNSIKKSNFSLTNNEQMGLNTALIDNKNNHINTNLEQIVENTKDTSTAQLLADLTNEAITAEICLRNQLKDVNLVKSSGDSSSPIIQQDTFVDTDIVVLKEESSALVAAFDINKQNTAHMEAQFIESSKSSTVQSKTTNEEDISTSPALRDSLSLNNEVIIEEEQLLEEDTDERVQYDDDYDQKEHKENQHAECNTKETENQLHESPVDSPKSLEDEIDTKKGSCTSSKLEILSVQELPPVSTDSTMTASEVEDNLEERLSQLDGTAIDSPPPNHDVDPNEKNRPNATATPPHTPTHQTLTQDIQELQQQLQHTPPTPVGQQVQQSNHQFQQNQQQQQQQHQANCFATSQSTSSSTISTLGTTTNMTTQSYTKDSDGGGAAELEDQDIEEVFKVLKGFEGGTTSDLNVCDLNVLFNEVYMKINETELGGSAGNAVGIAASSSSSTNTPNHINVTNPSIQLVKPTETEEGQMEIEKRQLQMQRKIDFLMRRLRKLQARYMCKHTSEEIAGLFEWSARQTSKGHTDATTLHTTGNVSTETGAQDSSKCFLKVIAARPPASEWKDIHESLVPANQLSTLLRKIESVANAQQLCTTTSNSLVNITHKKTKKALMEAQAAAAASSSAPNSSLYSDGKAEEIVVGTLEENVTDELSQVAGLLQSEMSEVQKAVDSDATESSSGGESADEMVTYNNTQQQTLPITKRAAWRYSRDRAAIASRWSWLLSQISDLEIKIRQHSELHQEIVRSKGLVTCGVNQSENEYTVNRSNSLGGEQENENEAGSCRTRGYVPSLFRKRKLIQTTNIHTISKKAARASTIKCGCQWPMHPCALCTGRLDPTAPRDLPDTMMMSDRIALLDSGYHPVLSFRENVNNALHFEAIAKQPEWQQRVMRCQAKNIAKNVWRAEREAVAAAAGGHSSSSKKYGDGPPTKRRYIKKKDRFHSEDKNAGGKSTHSSTGNQQLNAAATASPGLASVANNQFTSTSSTSTASLNDVGNEGMAKNGKKPYCLVAGDGIIKESVNSLQQNNMSLTSLSTTTISTNNNLFIHQTSDCLQTKFDPFNPNQTPSSLISNTNNNNSHYNNSKNNKHRKLSSSTTPSSHLYSHHYNNTSSTLYNGDSNCMLGHENWGGAGSGENLNIRSRTSSPTHGSSGSVYPKYERSMDRKNRSSYDIDNIVIPYSVAAATRVEILPYKEIPTPKWRVIENDDEKNKLKVTSNSDPHYEIHETSESESAVTNGHICDNSGKVDSIKSDKSENEDKTKKKSNIENLGSKDIEPINSKDSVEEKALQNSKTPTSLNNKHMVRIADKEIEHNDDNIKHAVNEENIEEPNSMKLKHEFDVIKKIEESDELQNELKYDELAPQSSLKASIEDDEDISDDAMFLRHERALTEERRKFQTYLKFPWSTRSRANRRIDSRAESSGANTPDPSSPAPQTPSVCGGDQESIPSPLNPATPLNPLDIISEAGDNSTSFLGVGPLPSLSTKRYERRRTTSTKKDRETERRSSTPDAKELIPPYEPLTFPLTDDQFEELLRSMPSDHSEDSKRFDECYLPVCVNVGGVGMGGVLTTKYPRTTSGSNSKRTSRSSTLCAESVGGGNRRIKSSNKNLRPISAEDSNLVTSHVNGDILLYDDEYDDDYPKHHLAPNDDHLTADNIGDVNEDDIYGDQYDAYVGRQQRKHRDSEVLSSEEEPFQDDDPNDPEWRGETEDRLRKKV